MASQISASEALCYALLEQGVEIMFGHPGGAILPFYDALYRIGAPRHVLMRHEQAAAHAADGYARATGRVGVCVATSGPGATNLVTGLATAIMDSVPMVAITGQVPTALLGKDAFQETDIVGLTMPVTKYGFLVQRPQDIPQVVREAFHIAVTGRPGPVVIDVPKDVQNQPCPYAPAGPVLNGRRPHAPAAADASTLDRAARMIDAAERPLIMAGRGVVLSGTARALRTLAERLDAPVITTLLGLDAFPTTHPLALGMPGMHGAERANRAIQEADVIIGLGLRFDDRVTGVVARFAPRAKIIHVDIDPVQVGRTVVPTLSVVADLAHVLPALTSRVTPAKQPQWWATLEQWSREACPEEPWEEPKGPLTQRFASRTLARHIGRLGAIVATDVGQHQMLIAQELRDAAPGTHLTSGGLGTMGYALPAAIGAALAWPRQRVWAVAGDGGFQMTMQELATVVHERIPLRVAVLNNGFLGMVRQWQDLFYGRRYSAVEIPGPDFVTIARAYGIPARTVSSAQAMEPALAWAEQTDGPVLLDLQVVREENVYPMVPAGASLDEMVLAPRESVTA
ncbi:MAG: biosynthetic-type acetolactate synthase large subunit [Gemmatimonadetes bacterium]|nr:biosynthetic-type acetolactate synthase large subunit [Gemmatimonadota bacterium]